MLWSHQVTELLRHKSDLRRRRGVTRSSMNIIRIKYQTKNIKTPHFVQN